MFRSLNLKADKTIEVICAAEDRTGIDCIVGDWLVVPFGIGTWTVPWGER